MRRMKVHRYKDGAAIREAKKRCRRLYNKFKNLDFVINDEKYFGLSGFQMASNLVINHITPVIKNEHQSMSRLIARRSSNRR